MDTATPRQTGIEMACLIADAIQHYSHKMPKDFLEALALDLMDDLPEDVLIKACVCSIRKTADFLAVFEGIDEGQAMDEARQAFKLIVDQHVVNDVAANRVGDARLVRGVE